MKTHQKPNWLTTFKHYLFVLTLNFFVQVVLRTLETILIVERFGYLEQLIHNQISGLILDAIHTTSLLSLVFPLYFIIGRVSLKLARCLFVIIIVALTILHFLLLSYFTYQLNPLDVFIFQYSIQEILITVGTSGFTIIKNVFLLLLVTSVVFGLTVIIKKKRFEISNRVTKAFIGILVFSILVSSLLVLTDTVKYNKFSSNKSLYFYSQSISYFYTTKSEENNAKIGTDYPLLRKFEANNELKPYFDEFSESPNIVILIVEGLNDDFIHDYKGIILMPFLSDLKDKSLYWNRCFTLGERSFAVLPSIIGSLPYGKRGFTLLDIIPRHFSLINVLKANGYHTAFFYGQGAWFHRKDRFLKYNNIDLIVDKDRFNEKYKKVVVGDFFWGYNDSDLFNQYFEVIDTIQNPRKLDIFFTGSNHAPFAISSEDEYNVRFEEIAEGIHDSNTKTFFVNHSTYIKSLLFVDDALRHFFDSYSKRSEFEKTIFIITGDHPMTELPIANPLKRFHVPLIIFSPKLKDFKAFDNVVSHLDVYEPVLSLIASKNCMIPNNSHSLSGSLVKSKQTKTKEIAFMNDNRDIIDYYSNGYYLSGKSLYKVNHDLSLKIIKDSRIRTKLFNQIDSFRVISGYVSNSNKLLPDSIYCSDLGFEQLYSYSSPSDVVTTNETYSNIVPSIVVKNQPFYFDVSFEYTKEPPKGLSVAFQLSTNQNDSLLYWSNVGFDKGKKTFQAHLEIPAQEIPDTVLTFKSYFYNNTQQKFFYSNLKTTIYFSKSLK